MSSKGIFWAHSNKAGKKELLAEHLKLVSERADQYAGAIGASDEARVAGLLHDLGKYGELFQRRLEGKEVGIDHWSAGAWEALVKLKDKGIASALCIQGHHIGLQIGSKEYLGKLNPRLLQTSHPLSLRISEADSDKLLEYFQNDGLTLDTMDVINSSVYRWGINNSASMLDIRMLFSALVDADFIETEAWFQMDETGRRKYRQAGPSLEPEKAFLHLQAYLDDLAKRSEASGRVNQMRLDLLKACHEASQFPQGLFTLTAPTGSGKTLAMLAFALAHAVKNGLRRIVIVIPYLTIIEQTARAYRQVFEPYFPPNVFDRYFLEHHSLSDIRVADNKQEIEDEDYQRRQLTENWDAPIILTTNVQFLESLFANRPSACRKLHRLAGSVILCDEVQTMPASLAIPTLATLSHLAERYHSTIVFATATQPAFSHLSEFVKTHCQNGWTPREIVPPALDLFGRARRTKINWLQSESISWSELVNKLAKHKQVLCVVNLKKHARALFNELKQMGAHNIFHLSTNMCPAHRQVVLNKVRQLLTEGERCYLISTQCVEAGVDIDFPVVYRAMGPLEAIAQAAGRCNRNGNLPSKGEVFVFRPMQGDKERLYPDDTYAQAASVTEVLLRQLGTGKMEIDSPELYQMYYQRLYSFARPEEHKPELIEAIKRQDFVDVARNYRVIEQDTINVLVPYDRYVYSRLRSEVLNNGLTRDWIHRAIPYSVSLFRRQMDKLRQSLETIIISGENDSTEWYIYRKEDDYDKETGLNPSEAPLAIIA